MTIYNQEVENTIKDHGGRLLRLVEKQDQFVSELKATTAELKATTEKREQFMEQWKATATKLNRILDKLMMQEEKSSNGMQQEQSKNGMSSSNQTTTSNFEVSLLVPQQKSCSFSVNEGGFGSQYSVNLPKREYAPKVFDEMSNRFEDEIQESIDGIEIQETSTDENDNDMFGNEFGSLNQYLSIQETIDDGMIEIQNESLVNLKESLDEKNDDVNDPEKEIKEKVNEISGNVISEDSGGISRKNENSNENDLILTDFCNNTYEKDQHESGTLDQDMNVKLKMGDYGIIKKELIHGILPGVIDTGQEKTKMNSKTTCMKVQVSLPLDHHVKVDEYVKKKLLNWICIGGAISAQKARVYMWHKWKSKLLEKDVMFRTLDWPLEIFMLVLSRRYSQQVYLRKWAFDNGLTSGSTTCLPSNESSDVGMEQSSSVTDQWVIHKSLLHPFYGISNSCQFIKIKSYRVRSPQSFFYHVFSIKMQLVSAMEDIKSRLATFDQQGGGRHVNSKLCWAKISSKGFLRSSICHYCHEGFQRICYFHIMMEWGFWYTYFQWYAAVQCRQSCYRIEPVKPSLKQATLKAFGCVYEGKFHFNLVQDDVNCVLTTVVQARATNILEEMGMIASAPRKVLTTTDYLILVRSNARNVPSTFDNKDLLQQGGSHQNKIEARWLPPPLESLAFLPPLNTIYSTQKCQMVKMSSLNLQRNDFGFYAAMTTVVLAAVLNYHMIVVLSFYNGVQDRKFR